MKEFRRYLPSSSRIWEAPDGTRWFWTGGHIQGWTGWQPHEDGHWFLSPGEFHHQYPTGPYYDGRAHQGPRR